MNKLSKIIVSIGLGGKTSKQIGDIKSHFEMLFAPFLNSRHALTTRCRKSNALFKIRKGTSMGIMCTFRKGFCVKMLKHLIYTHPDLYDRLSYDSNTLSVGISSHRKLKLENYNHKAPEYGMIFQIKFEPSGARIKYRRINPLKLKISIDKNECLNLLKQHVEH